MQLNNEVDIAVGCIMGVVGLVTLVFSVLSYLEQRAQRRTSLPVFNGQFGSNPLPKYPGWPAWDFVSQSCLHGMAWLGHTFAQHGQYVSLPQGFHSHAINVSNADNLPVVGNFNNICTHGAPPSVVSNPATSTFGIAQNVAYPGHLRAGTHTRIPRRATIVQQPLASSRQTVAVSTFPNNSIRTGQGGEITTSLRLPAYAYRRYGRSSGGIHRRTSARYLSRPFRDTDTGSLLQSRYGTGRV